MSTSDCNILNIDIQKLCSERQQGEIILDFERDYIDSNTRQFYISNGIIIILCKVNNGEITIDRKHYTLQRGNIVVIPENHIVTLHSNMNILSRYSITVTIDYILNMPSPIDTDIFSYSRYIPVMHLSDEKLNGLLSYYNFINKEIQEPCIYQSEIIRSIFYALLLEISAEYHTQYNIRSGATIKAESLSDHFFQLLAVYFREQRSVQFYADRLNLTPKYLSTAIKRITGRPILEWIHEAILIESKMLLRTTDLTVQQISEQLNFSSASAFVQFIKRHTGLTPKQLQL